MVETTLPFGASVVKGVIPKLRVDERERKRPYTRIFGSLERLSPGRRLLATLRGADRSSTCAREVGKASTP